MILNNDDEGHSAFHIVSGKEVQDARTRYNVDPFRHGQHRWL